MKIPKPLSIGEETFLLHCQANHLKPVREYRFCMGRKFAFDFCWPERMIAVEIEGGTSFGKSRHSRGKGFETDCIKYNIAARLGWKVLRYSTAMVIKGQAITDVLEML
jgi:very-short-patch-repair endonuclease